MADASPHVRVELRRGSQRPVVYEVRDEGFLVGSVPGCDLRLPGTELPPVICLIAPRPGGAGLRKLSPAYPVLVNGKTPAGSLLAHGDKVILGASELIIHVDGGGLAPAAPPRPAVAPDLDEREARLKALTEDLARQRDQLQERDRERRDRLAAMREAVAVAARKVQERKQAIDAEAQQLAARQAEEASRHALLDARAAELEMERQRLDEQRQVFERWSEEWQTRERQLESEQKAFATRQTQYQEDLVRLDRARAALEQREQRLQERLKDAEQRAERLQHETRDHEEQARQLHEWHVQLCGEADRLAQQKAKQDAVTGQLTERVTALEGQQASLTALRSRLEQSRDDLRRDEQQLAEQRARQAEAEAELQQQLQDVQHRRAELDEEQRRLDEARHRVEDAAAELRAEAERLEQLQGEQTAAAERQQQRAAELDAAAARQAEEAALVRAKAEQLMDMQERLTRDRQALREREAALFQSEHTRETLQEQLRRRAEELAERQKLAAELTQQRAEEKAALETRRVELQRAHQQEQERLDALRQEVEATAQRFEQLQGELVQREAALRNHLQRLKEVGRRAGQSRKAMHERHARQGAEHREAAAAVAQARAEVESIRAEAAAAVRQLPELELRARAAAERLAAARAQLLAHLEELHQFAGDKHADLERLRGQVQEEADRVRQQVLALYRAREEHRLAVAGFRQQLIAWQGQVADLKRSVAHDETRLERRQSEVAEAARAADATSARLAKQAEDLEEQERAVAERREEMDRHLNDLREWYRRKLRELAAGDATPPARGADAAPLAGSILALTGDVEPGDRQLGDLLHSLGLVDEETLNALLVEARRQRRGLRQLLLASGHVTLYQLALIEAGNLDALMLGPVRVVDRLRATPREAVYRVFDPRRAGGGYAVLRHLAEEEMQDAVHPDEFRQRFAAAAAVQHPHVAATYEVLEVAGRPAALQEWVSGLAGPEWSDLVAAPGICYRLLCQAALGLQTAHLAGLVHGRLHAGQLALNGDGILKLCGFGEPAWLADEPREEGAAATAADDLAALGRLAAAWLAPARAKPPKAKQAVQPLLPIVERLTAPAAEARYASAAALLEDLDRIGGDVPPNAEAWERLLRYVREHEAGAVPLRQSA